MLVDVIQKGLASFYASKDQLERAAIRRIGYDLFVIYSQLMEIVERGDQLLTALYLFATTENYDENPPMVPGFPLAMGKDDAGEFYIGMSLKGFVQAQMSAIRAISERCQSMAFELHTIAPDFKREIDRLLSIKGGQLASVLKVLADGEMPIPTVQDDGGRKHVSLPPVLVWRPENTELAGRYIVATKPYETLEQLREQLVTFRDLLEKHFVLADILLEARRERPPKDE